MSKNKIGNIESTQPHLALVTYNVNKKILNEYLDHELNFLGWELNPQLSTSVFLRHLGHRFEEMRKKSRTFTPITYIDK